MNEPVPSSALVVDTGPAVAVANSEDKYHQACVRLFMSAPGPLLIPEPLLTEITCMIATRGGPEAEARFLEDTVDGPYEVVPLAERLGLHQIATADHRHFSAVRPRHIPHFTLLPHAVR